MLARTTKVAFGFLAESALHTIKNPSSTISLQNPQKPKNIKNPSRILKGKNPHRRIHALFVSMLLSSALFANPWVMFSDQRDTYIYNQKTGEVYVRFKKGGKNYEDVFVKMPQGQNPSAELTPTHANDTAEQNRLMQRAQELKNSLYGQPLPLE